MQKKWSTSAVTLAGLFSAVLLASGCRDEKKLIILGPQASPTPSNSPSPNSPGFGPDPIQPPPPGTGSAGGGETVAPPTTAAPVGFTMGAFTLNTNPRDAVLATHTTSDGEVIAWIGSRDAAGLPASLLALRKFDPASPTVADTVLYGANGLPTLVVLRDGRTVTLDTAAGTQANLGVALPGGADAATTFPITSIPSQGPILDGAGVPLTNPESLLVVQVAVLEAVTDPVTGTPQTVPIAPSRVQLVLVQLDGGVSAASATGMFLGAPVDGQPGLYRVAIPAGSGPVLTSEGTSLYVSRMAQLFAAACASLENAGSNGQDLGELARLAGSNLVLDGASTDPGMLRALRATLVEAAVLIDAPCRVVDDETFSAVGPGAVQQMRQALDGQLAGTRDVFEPRREQVSVTATAIGTTSDGVPFSRSTSATFDALVSVAVPAGGAPAPPPADQPTILIIVPGALPILPTFQSLEPGQTVQLVAADAQGNPIDPGTLTFTSSTPGATVSPAGVVTAVSPGPVVVNVSSATQSGAITLLVIEPGQTAPSF